MGELNCFKAYDVRGEIGKNFNPEICYRISRAFAKFFQAKRIVIGYDARSTSIDLTESAIQGLRDEGVEVLITEDEHQITKDEYAILKNFFPSISYKSFRLLSRLDRIISGYPVNENNIIVKVLNSMDRFLLNNFTFLRYSFLILSSSLFIKLTQ